MPLPAALAARLAKRGIISKNDLKESEQTTRKEAEEEVFAESYDNQGDDSKKARVSFPLQSRPNQDNVKSGKESNESSKLLGYPGCPNKFNPYHDCTIWCLSHWGSGKKTPAADYLAKHEAMINKYGPLPEHWQEQYDPGTGRHFYWCTKTQKVSWLPPRHPKAKLVEAASHIREVLKHQAHLAASVTRNRDQDSEEDEEDEDEEENMDLDSDNDSEDNEDKRIEEKRRKEKEQRRKEDERYRRKSQKPGSVNEGKLDPMDPSSYSDAPRGNWSRGLNQDDED